MQIKLRQGNQKYTLLDSKYKIIWSYINFNKFHFTSTPVIWARNQNCGIGSKNKSEILYLFSILNSSVTNKVLESNLRSENEKDYLVSIASVKEFVRVPEITESNRLIKAEVIKRSEEMLALEEVKLADLVDFSNIMIQKFDAVSVKGDNLVLCKDKKERKLKIKSSKALVEKTITDNYRSDKLEFEGVKIKLSELKSLPAIDFEKQESLKDYMDDLVFALYFNIPLTKVGFEHADEIKRECEKSTYYQLVAK